MARRKNGSIEIVKLPVFLTTTTMDIMKYQKFRKSKGAPIRFISKFFWFGAHSGEVLEPNHRSQNIYIYIYKSSPGFFVSDLLLFKACKPCPKNDK